MPVKWTNRSRPPSSGVMKPKPLSSLNHFTVPVAIYSPYAAIQAHRAAVPRAPTGEKRTRTGRLRDARWSAARPLRSSELLGCGGDLIRVAGLGLPGQPQGVVLVARDDVDVKVEHRLPG